MSIACLSINDEFSALARVIIGLGAPYQRDKQQVAREMEEFPFVPDTDRRAEVLALGWEIAQDGMEIVL